MIDLSAGTLLISDPFLKDPNFLRTVVLVCEHQDTGSFGFILNKLFKSNLGDLLPELSHCRFPVFYGGPVQKDNLFFLHRKPELLIGGEHLMENTYWGGDLEVVIDLLYHNLLTTEDIRFFIGYSGWGEGQLENELDQKSWITSRANDNFLFKRNTDSLWKESLKLLGGEYAQMINYPIDPQLN